ncbi:Bifunctional NADP phosphatase/NAD kinase [uncultured archaeon]|nr:Bifunctional NADP phosphatase/NAD kinase [uncultured archaeon]
MDIRKALIIHSSGKRGEHERTMKEVRSALKGRKVKSVFVEKGEEKPIHVKGADIVISIGGDGTFIEAAQLIEDDTPILGVNSDPSTSEGAHAMATRHDFRKKLDLVLDGDFSMEKWTRLRPILGKRKLPLSLNEIFVGAEHLFNTSRYAITFHDRTEDQKSSGVLVATGCGSTAWYASAGGRPFSKMAHEGRFIVREPYCGHLVCGRIVQGIFKDGESISIGSKMIDGIVVVDSAKAFPFPKKSVVRIEISGKPLHVIVF